MERRRSRGLRVGLTGVALAAAACNPAARTAEETIPPFLEAVQTEDLDRLYCMVAGAAEGDDPQRRAGFEAWATERYEDYLRGRELGRVELDEHGLVLVKLFSLGRGTFFTYGPAKAADSNVVVVDTEIHFGYAHIDLSRFTPGTTFYVCGVPVGRVEPVKIPPGSGQVSVELLDTVRVRWTLVKVAPLGDCRNEWTVASAVPVEGSESSTEITWVF